MTALLLLPFAGAAALSVHVLRDLASPRVAEVLGAMFAPAWDAVATVFPGKARA